MKKFAIPVPLSGDPSLLCLTTASCFESAEAQNTISAVDNDGGGAGISDAAPAAAASPTPFALRPWEVGPVIQGGVGTERPLIVFVFQRRRARRQGADPSGSARHSSRPV